MKIIPYIYKTNSLYHKGIFVLISLVIILIAGIFIIPDSKPKIENKQMLFLEGIHLKYNDHLQIEDFFNSIKNNGGYLCLGTSESGHADYGNYADFLNNDTAIKQRFSILSGAGRTCGKYNPIFLQHKSAVKDLKIIYLINPVYWNKNLSPHKKDYWDRYSSYGMLKNINWELAENKPYGKNVQQYFEKLNTIEKLNQFIEYHLRFYRKKFFFNLKFLIQPNQYNESIQWVNEEKNIQAFQKFGEIDTEKIDTTWNILKTFEHKEWFAPIDENEKNRYEELKSFVNLCNELEIKATYIIGPYNERFIDQYQPESLQGYRTLTDSITQIMKETQSDYIDASDISDEPGAFIDLMHHSSYGAYLLYQKIKQHVHEKESH